VRRGVELERLGEMPFFRDMPREVLIPLARAAVQEKLPAGHMLLRQYDRARAVHFLVSGSVQILIQVGDDDLLVAVLDAPGDLIGWSAFRSPYRYTASVRCEGVTEVVTLPAEAFNEMLDLDPGLAYAVLQKVAATMAGRMQQARDMLGNGPPPPGAHRRWAPMMTAPVLTLLQNAPFFALFAAEHVAELARAAEIVEYKRGQRIFTEGEPATRLLVLAGGAVGLSVDVYPDAGGHAAGSESLQTVAHAGHAVGWSVMIEPFVYRDTATALERTRLVAWDREFLHRYARQAPDFGVSLMQAVVGVLGERLQALRVRLVARRYDDDVTTIRTLIEESTTELPVSSPLHRIPLYLEHRLTLADAFRCLDLVQDSDDEVECRVAALCADALASVREELVLYHGLQAIYDTVAGAAPTMSPKEVRARSLLGFRELFDGTRFHICGRENLPDQPGQIFVMNHLSNHPDNLLPNKFILTLDTHFVASMILLEKYGEAPIRVIRKARPDEYGHQRFYDRLGYIYTYSAYVDVDVDAELAGASREVRRSVFLDAAARWLCAGRNVLICPEGCSTSTEESPLRFRPGAFELAAQVTPEPLIVPIAVANFDKKITRTTTVAVVHEPFRLSDFMPNLSATAALRDFLNNQMTVRFYQWVREAVSLAAP
jgi:CRP-like cAMP-binding protein